MASLNSKDPAQKTDAVKVLVKGGRFALVDAKDFASVSGYTWFNKSGYAVRSVRKGEKGYVGRKKTRMILMHRSILRPPAGMMVDHKNGNRLDNRRSNLRAATDPQNSFNRRPLSATGYKGVYRYKRYNKWRAEIQKKFLGIFDSPEEAAEAYNVEAFRRFGSFAWLNNVRSQARA